MVVNGSWFVVLNNCTLSFSTKTCFQKQCPDSSACSTDLTVNSYHRDNWMDRLHRDVWLVTATKSETTMTTKQGSDITGAGWVFGSQTPKPQEAWVTTIRTLGGIRAPAWAQDTEPFKSMAYRNDRWYHHHPLWENTVKLFDIVLLICCVVFFFVRSVSFSLASIRKAKLSPRYYGVKFLKHVRDSSLGGGARLFLSSTRGPEQQSSYSYFTPPSLGVQGLCNQHTSGEILR